MNPDPLDVVDWHRDLGWDLQPPGFRRPRADGRRDNLATFGALMFGLGMIVGIIVWAVVGR